MAETENKNQPETERQNENGGAEKTPVNKKIVVGF